MFQTAPVDPRLRGDDEVGAGMTLLRYTQPVGLGRPAILQACLAGP